MSNNRKIVNISLNESFLVIKSDDHGEIIPLDCPICSITLRDKKDVDSYKKWECCSHCLEIYVYSNLSKWKKGWRPSADQRALERKRRCCLPSYLV